jgi:signal transduction histidine kinase
LATFLVLQGPDKGRTLIAQDDHAVLGRTSDLELSDHTVSRRHADLKRADGGWILTDLNSANGTYLNGVRLQKATRLKHGDQVRLGSSLLVYGGDESERQLSGVQIPTDMVRLDAGAARASVIASMPSNEDSVIMAAPDTAYAVKSWKAMNDLSLAIGRVLTPHEMLPRVLDIIFEQIAAERAVIFIVDEETGELIPETVRVRDNRQSGEAAGAINTSRTILNHVRETREGVLSSNVTGDERFRSGKSVVDMGMRSVICAPIVARDQVLGVIHLDMPVQQHTYNEYELRLITAIGYQTGLAIENARLIQATLERERLAAAGETVAFLSHSIKNILQGMRSGGAVVRKGLDKQDFKTTREGWSILDRNLDKCYRLMMNMLAFSKKREPYLKPLDINKLVNDVVQLMQKPADEKRLILLADLAPDVPHAITDYDGLHQVVLNLVTNAIDAVAPEEGAINVRSGSAPDRRHVFITVADNGPGVPPDQREAIFKPFKSSKGHGGTGLGLAVARKIAAELRAQLVLNCPPDGGAEFTIHLPTDLPKPAAPDDTVGPKTLAE